MHIFDKHDEEDDFRGVDNSSREEISSIARLIRESLGKERFLMIFHYGGADDIDLMECGIPPLGEGKLLWTYAGRFCQPDRRPVKLMPAAANVNFHLFIWLHEIVFLDEGIWLKEAAGVIANTSMDGISPETVVDCFKYSLFLTAQLPENSTGVDYGWVTHACNYWMCDGILGDDRAWEIGNALYGVMAQLGYTHATKKLADGLDVRRKPYEAWYSVVSNKIGGDDISNVPDSASPYFLTFHGDDPVYVRNGLFQLASNLRVLKLHNCTFDFASPPFQCCPNLRFLWLDHCANMGKEQSGGPTFSNLLVLDLRFTDYVLLPQMIESMTNLRELNTKGVSWKIMSHYWKRLQKLPKVRITESSDMVRVDSCSSTDMMNLELLDLSGNTRMESLPALSSARSLKMLVIDGCSNLEHVELAMEAAPPLLQSFSFDGYGPAENWTHSIHLPPNDMRINAPIAPIVTVKVTKISLHGCGRLQRIFLRGLPNLEELDLSGTAIKILDLSAMDVPKLKKLFLLGCEQLCYLFWENSQTNLEVLYEDTRRNKTRSMVYCGGQRSFVIEACIGFTDGRFIWSVISQLGLIISDTNFLDSPRAKVHILISCMNHTQAIITKSIEEIGSSQEDLVLTRSALPYNDISLAKDVTCSSLVWSRRQLQTLNMHMEIGEGGYNLERMPEQHRFNLFISRVESMHVHDNSSIIAFPPSTTAYWWRNLEWCLVERCPRLHSFFGSVWGGRSAMRIFSASDLRVAYCIWSRGSYNSFFQQLQHIYLYNCPRLVFVLPLSFTLPNLETLQVAYCSKLRHFFPLEDKCPEKIASGVTFENLKHIKLYHLHNLEQICEARLTAPALQTIGLRDCWALRRFPAVACEGPKPLVDCEKDLWDRLEWDGMDVGHHLSLFETRHSAYCKKSLPRGSYLR